MTGNTFWDEAKGKAPNPQNDVLRDSQESLATLEHKRSNKMTRTESY